MSCSKPLTLSSSSSQSSYLPSHPAAAYDSLASSANSASVESATPSLNPLDHIDLILHEVFTEIQENHTHLMQGREIARSELTVAAFECLIKTHLSAIVDLMLQSPSSISEQEIQTKLVAFQEKFSSEMQSCLVEDSSLQGTTFKAYFAAFIGQQIPHVVQKNKAALDFSGGAKL